MHMMMMQYIYTITMLIMFILLVIFLQSAIKAKLIELGAYVGE